MRIDPLKDLYIIESSGQGSFTKISTFKKIKFLGLHGVVLVNTYPLMYQFLVFYSRTDIDEVKAISAL